MNHREAFSKLPALLHPLCSPKPLQNQQGVQPQSEYVHTFQTNQTITKTKHGPQSCPGSIGDALRAVREPTALNEAIPTRMCGRNPRTRVPFCS